nr:SRPBCC domain-containing protein [Neobacillus sp. Marseille-Q6967]
MKMEYQQTFGLPRKMVWKYLKDEIVLKNAIPNCRSFTESTTGLYQGDLDIQIGPLKEVFKVEVRIIRAITPSFYHLLVKGKGKLGEIKGSADIIINEMQGASKVTMKADVEVSGILAGPAQRVLNGANNTGIESFLQRVEQEMKRRIYLSRKGK